MGRSTVDVITFGEALIDFVPTELGLSLLRETIMPSQHLTKMLFVIQFALRPVLTIIHDSTSSRQGKVVMFCDKNRVTV